MKIIFAILLLLSFNPLNSMNYETRAKVSEDRCLLQCTLGALESSDTKLFAVFEIDTPENRTAAIEQFKLLLRNGANLLANPPFKNNNEKLHFKIDSHFKSTGINVALLEKWRRENSNLTQISFKQLSDLVSSRLK